MLLASGFIAFFAYLLSSAKKSENNKIYNQLSDLEGNLNKLTNQASSLTQKLLTIKKINQIIFNQQDVDSLNKKEDKLQQEIERLNQIYKELKPAYDKKKRKEEEEESARRRKRAARTSAIGYGSYSSSSSSWSSGGSSWSGGGGGFSGGGASGGW